MDAVVDALSDSVSSSSLYENKEKSTSVLRGTHRHKKRVLSNVVVGWRYAPVLEQLRPSVQPAGCPSRRRGELEKRVYLTYSRVNLNPLGTRAPKGGFSDHRPFRKGRSKVFVKTDLARSKAYAMRKLGPRVPTTEVAQVLLRRALYTPSS